MERFPLPLGAWDGLRYFIVALAELSISLFCQILNFKTNVKLSIPVLIVMECKTPKTGLEVAQVCIEISTFVWCASFKLTIYLYFFTFIMVLCALSRDFTTILATQCRAFSKALKMPRFSPAQRGAEKQMTRA